MIDQAEYREVRGWVQSARAALVEAKTLATYEEHLTRALSTMESKFGKAGPFMLLEALMREPDYQRLVGVPAAMQWVQDNSALLKSAEGVPGKQFWYGQS